MRLAPSIGALYLSFTKYTVSSSPIFIGLANFKKIIHDSTFIVSIRNTLVYSIGNVFISMIIALLIALLLNRDIYFSGVFRTIYYVPQITSWITLSMIWNYLLNPTYGVINYLLSIVGIQKLGWFSDPKLAMPAMIGIAVWRNVGYDVVILLAALQNIPSSLYESASMDGANELQKFVKITFPMLVPTIVYIVVITGIFSLQAFDQIYQLTKGGPSESTITVVYSIYQQAFSFGHMGYASAQACVLFMIIFLLSFISLRTTGQLEEEKR